MLINPLGFTLENFDAVGRFRDNERGLPIDTAGWYVTTGGEKIQFWSVPELAAYLAESEDAHKAFIEGLFQFMINQPIRAFGDDTLAILERSFVENEYSIQTLLAEIATTSVWRVRELERQRALEQKREEQSRHEVPELEPGIRDENDNMPVISKMQIDLLVDSFRADFARVATLQYTNSVGQARMTWLGIKEGHHGLSHEGDDNREAQEKLTRINGWYAEQVAYLASQLAATPEPGGAGSLLDNTLIVWTNELGKGNTHTLRNIPFVLVGGGLDFKMGRALKYPEVPHNRFLLSLAHAMDHPIERFGNPDYCGDGPLTGLS